MIPVKEALNSGAWLHCECSYIGELIQFRFKVLSFRKISLSEIDEPENLKFDKSAHLWIMAIEVINVAKRSISTGGVSSNVFLIDQDGFEFNCIDDDHLWCASEFSKKSGLHRFYAGVLNPKIKTVGAIAFQLPDDDEAVYSLSLEEGNIREA